MNNFVILFGGYDNFVAIFLALDLYFRKITDMRDVDFGLAIEGNMVRTLAVLEEIFTWVYMWVPYLL